MYDLTISNARLADAPGLWDICAGNGQVLAVEPAGRIHAARETLRADGGVGFVFYVGRIRAGYMRRW